MEHWWIGWQMSKIRQKELLQGAARFRLLLEAGGGPEKPVRETHRPTRRLRTRLFALRDNLGQLLIDWGTVLQDHRALN